MQNILNTHHPFAQYLARHSFAPALSGEAAETPRMIVVIPSYNEPSLLRSLEALYKCRRPSCFVEVFVVINHSERAPDYAKRQNGESLRELRQWIKQYNDSKLQFHAIYKPDVPEKVAGVGYARKTGMDGAVYRFLQSGVDSGVIISFDADATCDENYFEEIERAFFGRRPINGASVYYEHPVAGDEFAADIYNGIALYELHLRYVNQALRYAGFPYAFHTVGSAFAVSAAAYVKQGGMNRRRAGEDFHFLQKIIPLGNYIEINTARVIPSPRQSDRVPFGTGASMSQWAERGQAALHTYPMKPFDDLKQFFALVPQFFKASSEEITKRCSSLPSFMRSELSQNRWLENIAQANANSASPEAFAKRFFGWFDGLKTIKYLNESCRHVYEKQEPEEAAGKLLQRVGYKKELPVKNLLTIYRKFEREKNISSCSC